MVEETQPKEKKEKKEKPPALEDKPFTEFIEQHFVPTLKESLNKEVFTICKSGKRSDKASRILSKFKIKSRSIEGGIEKVKRD